MKLPNSKRTGMYIALIVAFILSLLRVVNFTFFEILEAKTLDLQFSLRGAIPPGPDTLIAEDRRIAGAGKRVVMVR